MEWKSVKKTKNVDAEAEPTESKVVGKEHVEKPVVI
jgi:hypothetical protein